MSSRSASVALTRTAPDTTPAAPHGRTRAVSRHHRPAAPWCACRATRQACGARLPPLEWSETQAHSPKTSLFMAHGCQLGLCERGSIEGEARSIRDDLAVEQFLGFSNQGLETG